MDQIRSSLNENMSQVAEKVSAAVQNAREAVEEAVEGRENKTSRPSRSRSPCPVPASPARLARCRLRPARAPSTVAARRDKRACGHARGQIENTHKGD